MADNKDFLLGNKARELLCYTKHATKVVSDDASRRDVRMILHKIAQLEDIREVQKALDSIPGVKADVTLDPPQARIEF